jgi:hypothetical protein
LEVGALGTQVWIGLVERELSVLRASLSGRPDTEESEMVKMEAEVRFIPGEELDRSSRSGWTCPTRCAAVLDRALARVEEPERLSEGGEGGFTGALDMSHEPRPDERRGEER